MYSGRKRKANSNNAPPLLERRRATVHAMARAQTRTRRIHDCPATYCTAARPKSEPVGTMNGMPVDTLGWRLTPGLALGVGAPREFAIIAITAEPSLHKHV